MLVDVNDRKKCIDVWLSTKESVPVREILSRFEEYREQKYSVTIFRSGCGDLVNLTSQLLDNNK